MIRAKGPPAARRSATSTPRRADPAPGDASTVIFTPSRRARQHNDLARGFIGLERDLVQAGDVTLGRLAELTTRRLEIEAARRGLLDDRHPARQRRRGVVLAAAAATPVAVARTVILTPGLRARQHNDLAREIIGLERDLVRADDVTPERLAEQMARRLKIEAAEPPILRVPRRDVPQRAADRPGRRRERPGEHHPATAVAGELGHLPR